MGKPVLAMLLILSMNWTWPNPILPGVAGTARLGPGMDGWKMTYVADGVPSPFLYVPLESPGGGGPQPFALTLSLPDGFPYYQFYITVSPANATLHECVLNDDQAMMSTDFLGDGLYFGYANSSFLAVGTALVAPSLLTCTAGAGTAGIYMPAIQPDTESGPVFPPAFLGMPAPRSSHAMVVGTTMGVFVGTVLLLGCCSIYADSR